MNKIKSPILTRILSLHIQHVNATSTDRLKESVDEIKISVVDVREALLEPLVTGADRDTSDSQTVQVSGISRTI